MVFSSVNYKRKEIALKEAGESRYWIEHLKKSNDIDDKIGDLLLSDLREVINVLVSLTSKSKGK